LRQPSQVTIDKTVTVVRKKIGAAFRRLDADVPLEVERRGTSRRSADAWVPLEFGRVSQK